jgi:NAD(P)H-dependent FMN reductase
MNILFLYGSLREKSINKALGTAAREYVPEGVEVELCGVENLPLYNEDLENAFPPEARALKEKIGGADGVIIATPEFNRGMPGVLKNAIDWSSRPSGEHPWGGKPVAVLGASSGPRGAIVAQYDVKRTMLYFGAQVMGQPEFYLDNSDKKIVDGVLKDEKTKEYLKRFLTAFSEHVRKTKAQ